MKFLQHLGPELGKGRKSNPERNRIIPIFQAEISHRKIRGKITTLQQFFSAIGMIVASWTAYGCYVTWTGTGDSRQWRLPLAIQIIPALILGSMIYLFPEV